MCFPGFRFMTVHENKMEHALPKKKKRYFTAFWSAFFFEGGGVGIHPAWPDWMHRNVSAVKRLLSQGVKVFLLNADQQRQLFIYLFSYSL